MAPNKFLYTAITIYVLKIATSAMELNEEDFFVEGKINGLLQVVPLPVNIHQRFRRSDEDLTTDNNLTETVLTEMQQTEVLDFHNTFRRLEPAANMDFMSWSPFLASLAQGWAEECLWEHGLVEGSTTNSPYPVLGQNLYFSTGSELNITRASIRWYEEKAFYNFENATCQAGKKCGHYTALVWANSHDMGCGYHFCEVLINRKENKTYSGAHVFACEYGPGGNFARQKPYIIGEVCTMCDSGQNWCDTSNPRGLCRRDCNMTSSNCECHARCKNGGASDCNCTCQCPAGWTGNLCQAECTNFHDKCGQSPGYPKSACKHSKWGPTVRAACPELCGVCEPASTSPGTEPSPCPTINIVPPLEVIGTTKNSFTTAYTNDETTYADVKLSTVKDMVTTFDHKLIDDLSTDTTPDKPPTKIPVIQTSPNDVTTTQPIVSTSKLITNSNESRTPEMFLSSSDWTKNPTVETVTNPVTNPDSSDFTKLTNQQSTTASPNTGHDTIKSTDTSLTNPTTANQITTFSSANQHSQKSSAVTESPKMTEFPSSDQDTAPSITQDPAPIAAGLTEDTNTFGLVVIIIVSLCSLLVMAIVIILVLVARKEFGICKGKPSITGSRHTSYVVTPSPSTTKNEHFNFDFS